MSIIKTIFRLLLIYPIEYYIAIKNPQAQSFRCPHGWKSKFNSKLGKQLSKGYKEYTTYIKFKILNIIQPNTHIIKLQRSLPHQRNPPYPRLWLPMKSMNFDQRAPTGSVNSFGDISFLLVICHKLGEMYICIYYFNTLFYDRNISK